jgi:hypothetical protein
MRCVVVRRLKQRHEIFGGSRVFLFVLRELDLLGFVVRARALAVTRGWFRLFRLNGYELYAPAETPRPQCRPYTLPHSIPTLLR